MSSIINPYGNGWNIYNSYGAQMAETFWNKSSDSSDTESPWDIFSQQCDLTVSLSLNRVSEKLVMDLAEDTASYLVDYPELQDDYVLVIVDTPTGEREARAYHREDLVADLEGEEREKALEALKDNTLLYHDSAADLPEVSDDPDLAGLAAKAQAFLDKNEKLLNILERSGHLPWG